MLTHRASREHGGARAPPLDGGGSREAGGEFVLSLAVLQVTATDPREAASAERDDRINVPVLRDDEGEYLVVGAIDVSE